MSQKPKRLVAILDQGSNTLLLLVAEITGPGLYRVIHESIFYPRLGQGVRQQGALAKPAMLRSFAAFGEALDEARGKGATEIHALGTSALRVAQNSLDYTSQIESQYGIKLEVIAEAEEARLSYIAATENITCPAGQRLVVLDIGGSSTEVAISAVGQARQNETLLSLPLGAVTLTEKLNLSPPLKDPQLLQLRDAIKEHVASIPTPAGPCKLLGTAGTFNTLASIASAANTAEKSNAGDSPTYSLSDYSLRRSDLDQLADKLCSLSVEAIKRLPGLDPPRADIICAGAAIAQYLTHHLGAQEVLVKHGGIRKGYLIELAK